MKPRRLMVLRVEKSEGNLGMGGERHLLEMKSSAYASVATKATPLGRSSHDCVTHEPFFRDGGAEERQSSQSKAAAPCDGHEEF
jgi:hypothetical protein